MKLREEEEEMIKQEQECLTRKKKEDEENMRMLMEDCEVERKLKEVQEEGENLFKLIEGNQGMDGGEEDPTGKILNESDSKGNGV